MEITIVWVALCSRELTILELPLGSLNLYDGKSIEDFAQTIINPLSNWYFFLNNNIINSTP